MGPLTRLTNVRAGTRLGRSLLTGRWPMLYLFTVWEEGSGNYRLISITSVPVLRLRTLSLPCLEKRRQKVTSLLSAAPWGGEAQKVISDWMCRNGTKLCQGRFRMDIRTFVFTLCMVKCWNSLPWEELILHVCQFSRGIWIMPLMICFNFLLALK